MKKIVVLFMLCTSIQAEVITDGSLGSHANLPGPDYLIGADLGQQHGGNLFHSFQDFNLNSLESATFSGPNNVNNILSRVTGGNPSNIDGLIRSTIPNADFYFLNPNGIIFGPNARLDVQGSFHASTADYLRLGNGGRFDARSPSDSILTVAPIESFGFLSDSPASLSIEGSQLSVPTEKAFSIIGGNLTINQAELSAPFGRLTLASVASIGDVIPNYDDFVIPSLRGDITMQNSLISTTGDGGGAIYIRGGHFLVDNSEIDAKTMGKHDGGVVDIQANNVSFTQGAIINGNTFGAGNGTDINIQATEAIEFIGENDKGRRTAILIRSGKRGDDLKETINIGNAGKVFLQAKDIVFKDGAEISATTYTKGNGGDVTFLAQNQIRFDGNAKRGSGITSMTTFKGKNAGHSGHVQLQANEISATNDSYMISITSGQGDGGQIELTAAQINLTTGSKITTSTYRNGRAGTVILKADKIQFTGINKEGTGSYVSVSAKKTSTNDAGNILLEAQDILLAEGAYLTSNSVGAGQAGNIQIKASGKITITGVDEKGWNSIISSNSNPEKEDIIGGKGGNINLEAGQLLLTEGGAIGASSIASKGFNSGDSGHITILVKGTIEIAGVNPYGENENGFGSGIYARSNGIENNAGNSGNIELNADTLIIKDGAVIKNSTNNYASGGHVKIEVVKDVKISGDADKIPLQKPAFSQLQYLQKFSPSHYNQSTSGIYATSEDHSKQAGQSGNINLATNHLTLSNRGKISTSSDGGGKAGNIVLIVKQLHLDKSSKIISKSNLANHYKFASLSERDEQILVTGDVLEVDDIGNRKAGRYINTGNDFIRISPVYKLADMAAFNDFTEQYNIIHGDMVEIADIGNGGSARFIYAYNETYNVGEWVQANDNVILKSAAELNDLIGWFAPEDIPYSSGEVIQIDDMEGGKTATFIYSSNVKSPKTGKLYGQAVKINVFNIADTAILNQFDKDNFVQTGDIAIQNDGSEFIYQNNHWIKFNNTHNVADIAAMNKLTLAQMGNIAQIGESSEIYTGEKWIPLNHSTQIAVANLDELNKLAAKEGDLIGVNDVQSQYEHFFYVEGEWIKQIKGGDAGKVSITVDNIQVSNSEISTESVSAGGGSIVINTNDLVFLNNGKITASVKEGAGDGGNLTISKPHFIVLKEGQITAQAYEGQGGNIHIVSEQFIKSPNSLISASSKLGLNGEVRIDSPDVDMEGFLVVLPGGFVEAQLKQCTNEEIENPNTFKVDLVRKKVLPFEKFLKSE
ncbi:filamentous hemagglutinin N-terminal domain-containing protein [Candidatus Parabeggiatoa sp. HSG14]|uniref:two-partner secretion domain-containing protein n=1 Tax=Candidatus Parabeggiatoa sp. HSG14 TaxID=3055593 RepID=UPI0025A6E9BA|nr:filamentous hemagglutinin N-terminal domain-containing protein [Thiotrichales bacterium HSG14]